MIPDMEKFPVRMKDNDLLVTQLFEDPCQDPITALSVYVTPNVCKSTQVVVMSVHTTLFGNNHRLFLTTLSLITSWDTFYDTESM